MMILEAIKKLGFGSALGAGLGAWFFILYPDKMPGAKSVGDAMFAGACVGAGLFQIIDKYMIGLLMKPALKQVSFYLQLLKLRSIQGMTSQRFRDRVAKQLIEKHLLDEDAVSAEKRD